MVKLNITMDRVLLPHGANVPLRSRRWRAQQMLREGRGFRQNRGWAGLGWKGSREILLCFGGQFALPYTELEKLGVLRFPKRASGTFLLSDAKV